MPLRLNSSARGGGGGGVSSHTNQIMNAFLCKNTTSTRYEQKKYEEEQLAILSQLKRPTTSGAAQRQRVVEEMQPFWPADAVHRSQNNAAAQIGDTVTVLDHQSRRNNNQQQHSTHNREEEVQPKSSNNNNNSMRPTHLSSSLIEYYEAINRPRSWDDRGNQPQQQQQQQQAVLPSSNRQVHHHHQQQHHYHMNNRIDTKPLANSSNTGRWNNDNMGDFHQKIINHRSTTTNHNRHTKATTYQPLHITSTRSNIDNNEEVDEDIVCCDCDGGHWREGTKNICTISLWAIIVFAIFNRLFVHMNMALHPLTTTNKLSEGSVLSSKVDASNVGVVSTVTRGVDNELYETTEMQPTVLDRIVDGDRPGNEEETKSTIRVRIVDGDDLQEKHDSDRHQAASDRIVDGAQADSHLRVVDGAAGSQISDQLVGAPINNEGAI